MKLFGVVYTMSVWLPLPRAQNACFRESAVTDRDVAFHCTEIKKITIVKGSSTTFYSLTPKPCIFFFLGPPCSMLKVLYIKGHHTSLILSLLAFFYQLCYSAQNAFSRDSYVSVRGVCLFVGNWVLLFFILFFAVMLYRLLEY